MEISRRNLLGSMAAAGACTGFAIGCVDDNSRPSAQDLPAMPNIPYRTPDLDKYMMGVLAERNTVNAGRMQTKFLDDVRLGNIVYVPMGEQVRVVYNRYHVLGIIATDSGAPMSFDAYTQNMLPYETGMGRVPQVPGKATGWIKGKIQGFDLDKWIP